jgi:hypothetical protein
MRGEDKQPRKTSGYNRRWAEFRAGKQSAQISYLKEENKRLKEQAKQDTPKQILPITKMAFAIVEKEGDLILTQNGFALLSRKEKEERIRKRWEELQ